MSEMFYKLFIGSILVSVVYLVLRPSIRPFEWRLYAVESECLIDDLSNEYIRNVLYDHLTNNCGIVIGIAR